MVTKVKFSRGANGNFEIWFIGDDFTTCLYFSASAVGVYDAKTGKGKEARLS